MTIAAYETDNGPGGISWEIKEDGQWFHSAATRTEADRYGVTEWHTLAEWDAFLCEFCGESDPARPVEETIISPPISGYPFETSKVHPECGAKAARAMVE
jgi:hypothetical protein